MERDRTTLYWKERDIWMENYHQKKKKQNEKQQTTINCDKLTKNKFTTTIQYLELYNLYHVKVSVVVAN